MPHVFYILFFFLLRTASSRGRECSAWRWRLRWPAWGPILADWTDRTPALVPLARWRSVLSRSARNVFFFFIFFNLYLRYIYSYFTASKRAYNLYGKDEDVRTREWRNSGTNEWTGEWAPTIYIIPVVFKLPLIVGSLRTERPLLLLPWCFFAICINLHKRYRVMK